MKISQDPLFNGPFPYQPTSVKTYEKKRSPSTRRNLLTDLVVVDSVASASGSGGSREFRCSGTADRCGCDQHRAARISSGTGEFRSPISASVLRESCNAAAANRGDGGGGFSLFKSPAALREPLIVPPEKIGFPNIGELI